MFTKIQGRIVSFIGIVILDIMIPGMGRMNPRMMKKLQEQLEKATEEIDATKVTIETPEKTLVFDRPSVTIMDMMGQKTYQVVGEPNEVENEDDGIPEEDIELVMSQTNVSREKAISTLEECDGEPAEAIIKLVGE